MKLEKTKLAGCYELFPLVKEDLRGKFIKTFHRDVFQEFGLVTEFAEEYYSVSHKGVLRGLHFQTPPMQHTKLVYCIEGEVIDIVVDLRKQSKTYGEVQIFELSDNKANMVYIPEGMAHGFYVKSGKAVMMYKVTSIYMPEYDDGILWSSILMPCKIESPILSVRDRQFISLKDFNTPF